jgi:hypothetical protein
MGGLLFYRFSIRECHLLIFFCKYFKTYGNEGVIKSISNKSLNKITPAAVVLWDKNGIKIKFRLIISRTPTQRWRQIIGRKLVVSFLFTTSFRNIFSTLNTERPKYVRCSPSKSIHTVVSPFSFTVLPFDKVAPAFMWLAPSFERISHYTR